MADLNIPKSAEARLKKPTHKTPNNGSKNLDHRVKAAIPITDKNIIEELKDIISIQLQDNQKARWLDKELSNNMLLIR